MHWPAAGFAARRIGVSLKWRYIVGHYRRLSSRDCGVAMNAAGESQMQGWEHERENQCENERENQLNHP
ncbi:MAG: hypothetical protein ACRDBI_15325 [Shewanella sp.]